MPAVFDPAHLLLAVLLYMGGLILIARQAEKALNSRCMQKLRPYVYALSLGVYCSAWSFYGSVGSALNSGILFAAIFLGPVLGMALWWTVLRRLARIKSVKRITSIADFIAARYGNSAGLAVLATVLACAGSLPYIALQLRAINQTFALLSGVGDGTGHFASLAGIGPYIALLMAVFTIAFGIRRMDPTERHPGIMSVVAAESIFKLTAMLVAAGLAVWWVHDGPADLVRLLDSWPYHRLATMPSGDASAYLTWAGYLLLSMSAMLFLPRQFHAAVIENASERHILTALRIMPVFLLLNAACVLPIASAGLRLGLPAHLADTFTLRIPMELGSPAVSLFVFLGGFSAASGMVMIGTMTLSTMFTNHIFQPLAATSPRLTFFRQHLLDCRRFVALAVVVAAYLMEQLIGDAIILADIGMIAFTAALQFAPPVLAGLFWNRASRRGAFWGISLGGVFWLHTMLLPAFAKSGLIWSGPLSEGLFGVSQLNPHSLFGISGLDPVTHAMFWSLLFNIGGIVFGSLLSSRSAEEREQARDFTEIMILSDKIARRAGEVNIVLADKRARILALASQYHPATEAERLVGVWIDRVGLSGRTEISVIELADLYAEVQRHLSGSLGASSAHAALSAAEIFTVDETMELSEAYGGILAELKVTPDDLIRRIDYYAEREAMLTRHAEELFDQIRDKEREIAERIRVEDALRRAERNYRDIFENAVEGIFQSTPSGLFIAANPALARILGYSSPDDLVENVISIDFQVYADPSDRARLLDQVREKGQIEMFETRMIRKDGKLIDASVNMRSVHGPSGHVVYFEGSVQDITLRRAAEAEIRRLNEELEARVRLRTRQLEEANQELSQALDNLRQAQNHLVQSEKMAALGGLVAGVAHEVNTPVGVGVTAASHLETCTKRIVEARRNKTLTGAELDGYLETSSEAAAIILQNLKRAAELIRSFKMVAVDQTTHERRSFNLGEYVGEVLLSLRPKLRRTPHQVHVNCPVDLVIDSYPGAFSQVITNLVMNSLHHAYDEGTQGNIAFDISIDNDYLVFKYADDGKGMTPEVLKRVFDPFFTTNRSKGGTGLGLHILYNLVTRTLQGEVSCSSAPGQGTSFTIKIPLSELKKP